MSIASVGYEGTIDETQWANMVPRVGSSEYGVDRETHFAVTSAQGDRTVSVAPGTAWGHGVMDTSNAAVTLQLPTVVSGTRWDMIVIRRDWQPTGGTTSIVAITGTATKGLATRNSNRGVIDDQPIALVRVIAGATAIQEIVDLRVFARNHGAWAKDDLVRSYYNAVGTVITIGETEWHRVLSPTNAPTWRSVQSYTDTGWVLLRGAAAKWKPGFGLSTDYVQYRVRDGITQVIVSVTRTSATPITAGATGNINNIKVCDTPAPCRIGSTWRPMAGGPTGPMTQGSIESEGVFLSALSPNTSIHKADTFNLTAFYFSD